MSVDYMEIRDELAREFHLEDLHPRKREEILAKMGEALLKRIFLESLEKLGEEGAKEYEALLDREASQEELEQFFETKIPGYPVFVRGIVLSFKEEMQESFSA